MCFFFPVFQADFCLLLTKAFFFSIALVKRRNQELKALESAKTYLEKVEKVENGAADSTGGSESGNSGSPGILYSFLLYIFK